jgi:hypothetical protein
VLSKDRYAPYLIKARRKLSTCRPDRLTQTVLHSKLFPCIDTRTIRDRPAEAKFPTVRYLAAPWIGYRFKTSSLPVAGLDLWQSFLTDFSRSKEVDCPNETKN